MSVGGRRRRRGLRGRAGPRSRSRGPARRARAPAGGPFRRRAPSAGSASAGPPTAPPRRRARAPWRARRHPPLHRRDLAVPAVQRGQRGAQALGRIRRARTRARGRAADARSASARCTPGAGREVGEVVVDRQPLHAGAARDVGHRRPPDTHLLVQRGRGRGDPRVRRRCPRRGPSARICAFDLTRCSTMLQCRTSVNTCSTKGDECHHPTPRSSARSDGKAGSLGSIGVRFMIDAEETPTAASRS